MVSSIPSSLPRKLITDQVLAELRSQKFPVGDMAAPDKPYGWGTDPNKPNTKFIPYLSLTPGPARRIEGALSDSSTEYETNYAVVLCGVSRKGTEALADNLRRHLHSRERLTLTHTVNDVEERWRITQYRCVTIGGLQRIKGAFPDYYIEQDDYLVRVSKEQ